MKGRRRGLKWSWRGLRNELLSLLNIRQQFINPLRIQPAILPINFCIAVFHEIIDLELQLQLSDSKLFQYLFFCFPESSNGLDDLSPEGFSSVLNMILWSCGVFISQASCSSCIGSGSLFILFPTIYSYTTGLISFSDLRYTQLFYPFDRSHVCPSSRNARAFSSSIAWFAKTGPSSSSCMDSLNGIPPHNSLNAGIIITSGSLHNTFP